MRHATRRPGKPNRNGVKPWVYFKCALWWFHVCVHCEMMTTVRLINTPPTQLRVCSKNAYDLFFHQIASMPHGTIPDRSRCCVLDPQNGITLSLHAGPLWPASPRLPLPQALRPTPLLSSSFVVFQIPRRSEITQNLSFSSGSLHSADWSSGASVLLQTAELPSFLWKDVSSCRRF